jgi:DNA-binding transcriptional regulator YhcF (GntR family)
VGDILVEHSSGEPVYRQVARQIREQIVYGRLAPGDRLPSVRTLASDLGVNLNTVARAYRALEEDGFVTIAGRSKVEVAAPRTRSLKPAEPSGRLLAALRESLAKLRQSGLTPDELRRMVAGEIKSMADSERDA